MCVNVLLFGPITADMLVRDGHCQPGVDGETPEPVGLVTVTSRREEPNI